LYAWEKEGSTTAAKFAPTMARIEKVLIMANCIHVTVTYLTRRGEEEEG
jgi:hypothetical protein